MDRKWLQEEMTEVGTCKSTLDVFMVHVAS